MMGETVQSVDITRFSSESKRKMFIHVTDTIRLICQNCKSV